MNYQLLTQNDQAARAIARNFSHPPTVKTIEVKDFEATFTVQSQTQGDVQYVINFRKVYGGRELGRCSCPARVICKHLTAAYAVWQGVLGMRSAAPELGVMSINPGVNASPTPAETSATEPVRQASPAGSVAPDWRDTAVLVKPTLTGEKYGGAWTFNLIPERPSQMTVEEIYAIEPDENGWRKLPNGNYVKLGSGVKLGDYVKLGSGVTLGNYVTLGKEDIICAGRDQRGWEFLGLRHKGMIVTAGCRWFSLPEAREHWTANAEALAKLDYIETEAKRLKFI